MLIDWQRQPFGATGVITGLAERPAPIQIEKTGRGRFRLVQGRPRALPTPG